MIFPIIDIMEKKYGIIKKYPNLQSWYENMKSSSSCDKVMLSVISEFELIVSESDLEKISSLTPAIVPDESLYKCDPSRQGIANCKLTFNHKLNFYNSLHKKQEILRIYKWGEAVLGCYVEAK